MFPGGDSVAGRETPHWSFTTTHWSVVLTAKQQTSAEAEAALERLCRIYWWPLYAFLRRRGYEHHEAEDLTQEFFARLLAKDFLRAVDQSKGKFRSYLLASMENFLAKQWRRAKAQKRGGGLQFVSLDADLVESRYAQVATATTSAEKVFEQQWALTVLDQVVSRLREEFRTNGKKSEFEALKTFLTGERRTGAYAEMAEKLGTTEPAVKMIVYRMRQRYGELLHAELAQTVSRPEDVEEELRALFAALG